MIGFVVLVAAGVLVAGGIRMVRRGMSPESRPVKQHGPMPATRRWGMVIGLGGVAGLPIAAFMTLATANACGMFGDGCDDYGQTGAGFEVALAALGVCVIGVVVGLVLAVIPRRRAE